MVWLLFMIENGVCKVVTTRPKNDFANLADLTKHYALFRVLSHLNFGDGRDSAL